MSDTRKESGRHKALRVLTQVYPSLMIIGLVENILPLIDDTQDEQDKCTIRLLMHHSHGGALIGRKDEHQ
ncbi:hypothetical protein KIN20_018924 [Parelaphostrongylus tenuis]|uniref:Uncharacterized protein n=1 Tax=Parelaphostrongylus tenuis TaxID=148309 RepID=A0AAD5N819_PARTN|nr:hypothetical protein KIN20_018924 [Parelaphostrongylus tenuis]